MAQNILFIHSAGNQTGEEGSAPFLNYLRRELGGDFNLEFPMMPEPDKPSYLLWQRELQILFENIKSPVILIGHSLGGSVLLKYLSEQKPTIFVSGLFIVAAPFWGLADWELDEFVLPKDFARSLPESLDIYFYQSKDDEVVPINHIDQYAKSISQAKVRMLDKGGHTFKTGLPELIEDILLCVKDN